MRLTIEIETEPGSDTVTLSIRKAASDAKAKTILSYAFDRPTAKMLVINEIESILARVGDAKVRP